MASLRRPEIGRQAQRIGRNAERRVITELEEAGWGTKSNAELDYAKRTNCPRISMQPVSTRNLLQFQKNINGLRIDGHYANASTQSLEPTEYSVPIPVDLFVAAPEISDWRRGRRSPKNGRRSSSIIREYSHLSAKTAPPIHGVTVDFRCSIRRWRTPSMRSQTPRRQ